MKNLIKYGIASFLSFALFSCSTDLLNDGEEYVTHKQYVAESPSVTISEAKNVAAKLFLSPSNKRLHKTKSNIQTESITPITDNNGNVCMYVMSFGKNKGYAIISGTKKCSPILAVSENLDLSNENLNDWIEEMKIGIMQTNSDINKKWNLNWLLYSDDQNGIETQSNSSGQQLGWWRHQTMTEVFGKDGLMKTDDGSLISDKFCSIDELSNYLSISDSQFSDLIAECEAMGYRKSDIFCQIYTYGKNLQVGPLLSTTWSQRAPYNGTLEKTDDRLGCVTVAVGQFMYYYKEPTFYNWEKIGIVGSTEQQTFLRSVGEQLGIDYKSSSNRSAKPGDAWDMLLKNGYSISRTSTADYNIMRKNLTEKKPFLCDGHTSEFLGAPTGDGHMWMIDGFKEEGKTFYIQIYAPVTTKPSNNIFTENPYKRMDGYTIQDGYVDYYFHMNWGGTTSWNVEGNYYWDGSNKSYSHSHTLIYKK